MHRHGYQGRKFGRKRDQREALLKGLSESLILNESIETTVPKAKEAVRYTEKLITKAKKGDLHSRRQIISKLSTIEAANKLVDDITPRLSARTSGFFRIKKTEYRRGDNTLMAKVTFVDDLAAKVKEVKPVATKPKASAKKPTTAKKTVPKAKKETK